MCKNDCVNNNNKRKFDKYLCDYKYFEKYP